jgi:hypothetical protein
MRVCAGGRGSCAFLTRCCMVVYGSPGSQHGVRKTNRDACLLVDQLACPAGTAVRVMA